MPIVDVEAVGRREGEISAQRLADALGAVFGAPPGHTWVRVRVLAASAYAENGAPAGAGALPVFVSVLQAHPPEGERRALEAMAVTAAVAACLDVPVDAVHVQYAPAAGGRQAFGGRLVA